jgi:hypothetical protein
MAKNNAEANLISKLEEYEQVDLLRTWSFVGFVE